MDTSLVDKIVAQIKSLPQDLQRRILEMSQALAGAAPRGVAGRELLRFGGAISAQDAAEMRRIIDEGCGQVDSDAW